MILKCFDGPMDGAVYELDRQAKNTNRKPDGFWFDARDEHTGRWVQHQYAYDKLNPDGNHVTLCYKYTGPVVDTGISFETQEQPHDA